MRRVAQELGWFSLFAFLAVVLTWPLATQLDTAVSDRGDPFLTTWIIDWVAWSLTHAPLDLYNAPIFYPHKYPFAYSENLVGLAIFVLPFHLLGLPPTAVHGLAMLFSFALAGYGAFVLARMVSGNTTGAIIAGIFFGFVSYKFDHLPHIHIINSGWIPLFLAALLGYRRDVGRASARPDGLKPVLRSASIKCAALVSATFVMLGLTNVYYLLFCSAAAGLTILLWLLAEPTRRGIRDWLVLTGALVLGGLVLLPFLLPYRVVAAEYKMRRVYDEVRDSSAKWSDWVNATPASFLYGDLTDPRDARSERHLFPGLLPLFLTAVALLQRRREERVPDDAWRTGSPASPDRRGRLSSTPPRLLRTLDVSIAVLAGMTVIGWASRRQIFRLGDDDMVRASDTLVLLLVLAIIRWSIRLPDALGGAEGKSLRSFFEGSRFNVDEWSAALWIGLGFLGSWGVDAFFHDFLFWRIEIFQSLRVTARWAVITYVGLAVWSALGVATILRRRSGWRHHAVAAVMISIALIEVIPILRWEDVERDPSPVYQWMRDNRRRLGPTLELPMSHLMAFEYVRASTTHHVPIFNGTSGFEPPLHVKLRQKDERNEFDDEFLSLLERNGAKYIVVHVRRLEERTGAVLAWLQRNVNRGRLGFVRRFDDGDVAGDWVFAIPRNARDWESLRGAQAPDRAGHIPDENLARLFAHKPVYNASTFYNIETPRMHSDIDGELKVSGWAVAPAGIRSVTARIHEGRQAFEARLFERGDVTRDWPWYPQTPRPGFIVSVPKRPAGVPRDTDLYLDIVDGEGRVLRTPDMFLSWK